MKVCASLACWPGARYPQAIERVMEGPVEPLWGPICISRVQLVPQTLGCLTEELASWLTHRWPGTEFRLHANVRILPQHRMVDLGNLRDHGDWLAQAARVSQQLKAPAYTAHAGRRSQSSMESMLDNLRLAADVFGCPVGVEGMYPATGDPWLISTWHEYRLLLDCGLPYALDLSHIHILATHSGRREAGLLQELLSSEQCIELHVSANDGSHDAHQPCRTPPPWWFDHLNYLNPCAAVFSEGNQRHQSHGVRT